MFCWDDPERSAADLEAFLALARRAGHDFDPAPPVLAGFSQGGNLALRTALSGRPFEVGHVLGVCPSFPGCAERTLALIESSKSRVRGHFIAGERDEAWRAGAEIVQRALAEHGHRVSLEVVPGLGHDLPTDCAGRLAGRLRAIAAGRK